MAASIREKMGKRLDHLHEAKATMVKYLKLKLAEQDWHGVADAAMDIREIKAQIDAITDIDLSMEFKAGTSTFKEELEKL